MKLNARQKSFIGFYWEKRNATEAAKKAGYSEKTAYSIGQRLLKNVEVKDAIDKLIEQSRAENIAKVSEIEEFLSLTMRGEIQEEVVVVEGEGVSSARIIKKQVSAKERIKAAELLGKRHALFTDKTKLEGTLPVMIVGEDDLDE